MDAHGDGARGHALMMVICRTWEPPFAYRTGDYPPRDLISRVNFQVQDDTATEAARLQKRRETFVYYINRPQALDQRREELKDQLFLVLNASSFDQMTSDERRAFNELYEEDETAGPGEKAADKFACLSHCWQTIPT